MKPEYTYEDKCLFYPISKVAFGFNWNRKAFMHTNIVDWREICYYRIVRGL